MSARHRYLLIIFQCFLLLFIFSSPAFSSDVVINEFLPDLPSDLDETVEEWVELYNQTDQTINLTGWVLKDAYDNHCLVIENQIITPKGFVVIKRNKSTFSLNNDKDDVRLFNSTASATPVDSFSYPEIYKNTSWGRIPDGVGEFINKLTPTPGGPNLVPTPDPTPTPQPSSSSTTSSDTNDEEDKQSQTSQQSEDQNQQEYRGVVAGYKTTIKDQTQEKVSDLEISPIFEASSSATTSAFNLDNENIATKSSILQKKVNLPIISGSGFIITGIVATLLKRYNISSLWKKIKSWNS